MSQTRPSLIQTPDELEAYKATVRSRIEALLPVFADLTVGNIGKNFEMPEADDEFSPLYVGISTLLEVVQEQFEELKKMNASLEVAVKDRTRDLLSEIDFSESILKAQSDLGQGVAIVDGSTNRFLYVNEALCQMYGYSKEELLALENYLSLVPPEERKRLMQQREKRLAGEKVPDHYDTVVTHKNGRLINIEISLRRVEQNNHAKLVVILRDITAKKNYEEELERRVSERTKQLAQYERIVELARHAIIVTDLEHRIRFWNQGAVKKYGFSKEEAVGKVMYALLNAEYPEPLEEIVAKTKTDGMWEGEAKHNRKNGEQMTVLGRWALLSDPLTNEPLILKINQDITRQKEMEADLRFLANVSEILSSSLDYKKTLTGLAKACVPYFADWCAVDLLNENNEIERMVVYHSDPAHVELGYEFTRRYPTDMNAPTGIGKVLRTGEAELMEDIPMELVVNSLNHDPEKMEMVKKLNVRSYISTPLIQHDVILGAITFVMSESPRRYNVYDLSFSYELARRAAAAIDNARSHTELEQRVKARTHDLHKVIAELQKSEAGLKKWADIFENIKRGVLVGSPEGTKLEMMNPAFAEMLGYTAAELIGKPIAMLIPEEYQAEFEKNVKRIRQQGYLVWESMALKKDSSMIPVRIDLTVPKSEQGRPLYYIATVRDISSEKIAEAEVRKAHEDLEVKVRLRTKELQEVNELLSAELVQREQAETALRESHLRTAAILGSITDAYLRFDTRWNIRDLNRQAELILGRGRMQLLGRNLWREFPDIDQHAFIAQYEKIMKSHAPMHFESHLTIANKWFESHAYPTKDGLTLYLRDITERKAAEENLKRKVWEIEQAKVKDEALLASIGEPMFAVDIAGKIMFLNREAESVWGIEARKVVNLPINEAAPIVDAAGHTVPFEKRPLGLAIKTGKRITQNKYFLKRNEKKIPLSITATPIVFEGKAIGAIGVSRDVTKEREVDKAKSEFVALASHQLRTPLTITSWYAEKLLEDESLASQHKEQLEELYRANRRMAELVDALLNVSRLETGTLPVEPAPLQFVPLIESVLSEFALQIENKKLSVFKNYDSVIPTLHSDEKLIRIILQNLIGNAVKYTEEGGSVTLLVQQQEPDILLVVDDTGYGIPLEAQTKIFNKLYRADNAREKESDGSGLGLYIVKMIMDKIGGHIWFESEEGRGTKFYVSLPMHGAKKGAKRNA